MLAFLKKYGLYGIVGLIVILSLIAFEPMLTSLLFTRTAPPIKVYKAVPLEKRENRTQVQAPRIRARKNSRRSHKNSRLKWMPLLG